MGETESSKYLTHEQREDTKRRIMLVRLLNRPDLDIIEAAELAKKCFDYLNSPDCLAGGQVKKDYTIEYASIITRLFTYLDSPDCELGNAAKEYYRTEFSSVIKAKDQIEKEESQLELATFDRK